MRIFNLLFLIYFTLGVHAQKIDTLTLIHDTLPEISGMNVTSAGTIWGHNDSGDDAVIHEMDTNGNLLRSVVIGHSKNVDWEDMTKDNQGNYYIGDFGNNLQKRKDLTIYKIASPEINNDDTLFADSVVYTYPDQSSFPPTVNDWNFDCESLIWYADSLFVFSKNWGPSPITTMYRIQDTVGTYKSDIAGTYNTGGFITAAALSPNEETLVLLSQDYIWVFYDFNGSDFFGGEAKRFEYAETQKEACSFMNDSILYFADEKIGPNYLYQINISDLLDTSSVSWNYHSNPHKLDIIIGFDQIRISGIPERMVITLFNINGAIVKQLRSSNESELIKLTELTNGIYLLKIEGENIQAQHLIPKIGN